MINICVFSEKYVEIESAVYEIQNRGDMVKFLKELLDKVHYGGEKICLEEVTQDSEKGVNLYSEIDRWP